MRSSTLTNLHISEHGKICAKDVKKAREIRTGALNTVHVGQKITIESTAEGREGDFYEFCQTAQQLKDSGEELNPLQYKFHFFPWYLNKGYMIKDNRIVITPEKKEYFDNIEHEADCKINNSQRRWYIQKEKEQGEDMKREFPSTPKEAFEQAIEGTYFHHEMATARKQKRIGQIPFDPNVPVNTFWDIGIGDHCAIWFHQRIGLDNRFIGYYENSGEAFPHYAQYLKAMDCICGGHYLPHDANNRSFRKDGTLITDAHELLTGEIYLVPRTNSKQDAIAQARRALHSCWFDTSGCEKGITHLDNYRKEWNEQMGVWRKEPRHDDASHGADAFMTFATGYNAHQTNSSYAEPNEDDDWGVETFGHTADVTGY
jgi:hypothetical protein